MIAARNIASASNAWLIRPDAFNSLQQMLSSYWDDDDDAEEVDPGYRMEGNVCVIDIDGRLMNAAPSWWFSYMGYESTPELGERIEKASADANVKAIVLNINSPGGQAQGIATLADMVYAVRGMKPIQAFCQDACSAAYWIASQCDSVWVAQDGYTGCIGTVTVVADTSKMYDAMGVTLYRVTSDGGEVYKGAGANGTEITPEQLADFKRLANEHQELFSAAIMRGRGMYQKTLDTIKDGRYYVGQNGVKLRLADGVKTFDEVLAALNAEVAPVYWTPPPLTKTIVNPEGQASSLALSTDSPDKSTMSDSTAAASGERKTKMPKLSEIWNSIKAPFVAAGFEDDVTKETTTATQTAIPPEVTAELERLRASETSNAANRKLLVDAKRPIAEAAAVRAFNDQTADGKAALESAKKVIAAMDDPGLLDSLTETYNTAAANHTGATGHRQTVTSKEAGDENDEARFEKLFAMTPLGEATLARMKGGK